jgi:hypothetical protein
MLFPILFCSIRGVFVETSHLKNDPDSLRSVLPAVDFSSHLSSSVSVADLWPFADRASYRSIMNKWHIDRTRIPIDIFDCCFAKCRFGSGGAVRVSYCDLLVSNCRFFECHAKNGGALSTESVSNITVESSLFLLNFAQRFGAVHFDGCNETDSCFVKSSNFSHNSADEFISAVRIQHNGGTFESCVFEGNQAGDYGPLWDYSHQPGFRTLRRLVFVNNSSVRKCPGFTIYHLHFDGLMEFSQFFENRNQDRSKGVAIYLHSDRDRLSVSNCVFDVGRDEAIWVFFEDTSAVELSGEGNSFGAEMGEPRTRDSIDPVCLA